MPKRAVLTPVEKVAAQAAKKQKLADDKLQAKQDGWRLVDKKIECFYPAADDLPREDAFLRFQIRGSTHRTRFSVFRKFFTDEIMMKIKINFEPAALYLGGSLKSGNARVFRPKLRYMWQALAIEIRLIGLQEKQAEGAGIKRPLRASVERATEYFKN